MNSGWLPALPIYGVCNKKLEGLPALRLHFAARNMIKMELLLHSSLQDKFHTSLYTYFNTQIKYPIPGWMAHLECRAPMLPWRYEH